jgi:endoglucanase
MDEIGFRVTHIDDKGFIHVQKAGVVRPKLYVGAPMQIIHEAEEDGQTVWHKVNGVGAVDDALLRKEEMKDSDLLIDIGADSREEAAALVGVGDSVCADTQVRALLNDRFCGRALDDKTGAFIILEAAKQAAERGATCGIHANTVVGEEIYQKYGLEAMEVTDDVFLGKQARQFDEAENRMHTIKAVMYATLK